MVKKILALLILPALLSAQLLADETQDLQIRFDGAQVQRTLPAPPLPIGVPSVPGSPLSPARESPRRPNLTTSPSRPRAERPGDLNDGQLLMDLILLFVKIGALYPGDVTNRMLRDGAYRGVLQQLDANSRLYTPEEWRQLEQARSGSFAGVGLLLDRKERNEHARVRFPFPNTPAYRAGIGPGDTIVKVNGLDTTSMNTAEVTERIRGPVGTIVALTILPAGSSGRAPPREVTLRREEIHTVNFQSTMLTSSIGYIGFNHFNNGSFQEFQRLLNQLAQRGLRKLIIDLRDNPGGNVSDVVNICRLFLSKDQAILQQRGRTPTQTIVASEDGAYNRIPIVVLVNKGSASASEILAGVLQDHRRARLIGSPTYGKGSVQRVFPDTPEAGYGMTMTIARYYLPSNRSVEPDGLTPDIAVSVDRETEAKIAQNRYLVMNGQSPQETVRDLVLEKALEYLSGLPASR